MYHCNEMYWETYLSDQTNRQTVISLKILGEDEFWTKWDRYNMK